MLTILIAILVVIITVSLAVYIENKKGDPAKIFGIYSQPGRWHNFKYVAFLTILSLRRLSKRCQTKADDDPTSNSDSLESLQTLSDHEKAVDAVFFQAVGQDGYTICGGLERRHRCKANGLFYVTVPGVGLLSSMKLPSTLLEADTVSLQNQKEYSAEGIRFAPVVPMKKWKVSFDGKMKMEEGEGKVFDVKLDAEWTSDMPYFLYERDMSCRALARAIAREKWTREFFDTLKKSHQTHYEQVGKLKGNLVIDGKTHPLEMAAFRDHSFAYKRDWSLMHRYIFNMFYLEDGTFAIIGVVSQPCTTSTLEVGYVATKDGELHAIEFCNLQLYQHAERGRLPTNYGFTFVANGTTYDANVNVEHDAYHFKGTDDEAKLYERFVRVDVNGIKGRGISEWHYNNKQ